MKKASVNAQASPLCIAHGATQHLRGHGNGAWRAGVCLARDLCHCALPESSAKDKTREEGVKHVAFDIDYIHVV